MPSVCPGSSAFMHAKAQVQVQVQASCSTVRSEMLSRVTSTTWTDPHNGGSYAIEDQSSPLQLKLSRVSGSVAPGRYTDKLSFDFTEEDSGSSCTLSGCSESQGSSFHDYSTNYCNLRMLYCAAADGCATALHDFTATELDVASSEGAGTDASACMAITLKDRQAGGASGQVTRTEPEP